MEKVKYIVSRLAIIAIGTAIVFGALKVIVHVANNFGFSPQHIIWGVGVTVGFGLAVWWGGGGSGWLC